MKRPNIEQMRDNLDLWPEPGLGKRSALELIEYTLHLEANHRNWPSEVHEQYLVVLNERDALQEQVDRLTYKLEQAYVAYQASIQDKPEHL
jgi:hypothetical protein